MSGKGSTPPPAPGPQPNMHGVYPAVNYDAPEGGYEMREQRGGQQQPQQAQQYGYGQAQQPQWNSGPATHASTVPPTYGASYYVRSDEQSKCSIVVSLVFSLIVVIGCIMGLALPAYGFGGDVEEDFQVRVGLFKATLVIDGTGRLPPENHVWQIAEWPSVDAGLAALQAPMRFATAVYILLMLFCMFLVILQVLRLCGQLNHRPAWTHITCGGVILFFVLLIISTVFAFTRADDLEAWRNRLAVQYNIGGGISQQGGTGTAAGFFFVYIPIFVLIGFAVRTWAGRKCLTCCCDCCMCTLAPDAPPENIRQTDVALPRSGPTQGIALGSVVTDGGASVPASQQRHAV